MPTHELVRPVKEMLLEPFAALPPLSSDLGPSPFLQAGQRRLFNVDAVRTPLVRRAAAKGGAK